MLRTLAIIRFFRSKTLWLSVLSALLLDLAFPKTALWPLAWVGLVPLLSALEGKGLKKAFLTGYLCGVLFFIATMYWFIYVTILGAVLLILYLAVYFGLFACGVVYFSKRSLVVKMLMLACLWVVLEYIRAHAISGFSWASLGQSQAKVLPVIQMADVTGMFGISFLVVNVNVLLHEIIRYRKTFKEAFRAQFAPAVFLCAILMGITLAYGAFRLHAQSSAPKIKIAIVQANTAQETKWDPYAWPSILRTYIALTNEAAGLKPDLIIWPETSFPGYVWESPYVFEQIKDFVREIETPLLLGLVTKAGEKYYNSAMLIDKDGTVRAQHDKIHLVPFGEYIPFRKQLPFLSTIVPIDDFSAGKQYTLFPADENAPDKAFSVLICFEDTVSRLSQKFVKTGANLLVNMTNDAWFYDTKAPFIHLYAALFRTIENRRALVRAANTGVSCFIDAKGRIEEYVQDTAGKKTFVADIAVAEVALEDQKTFYNQFGDVFTYLCFGGILMGMVARNKKKA